MICRGEDSEAALDALLAALASATAGAPKEAPRAIAPGEPARPAAVAGTLAGVCASPGLASGPLARLGAISLPADDGRHRPEEQHLALDQALQRVRDDVQGACSRPGSAATRTKRRSFPRISRCWKTRVCWTPPTC